MLAGPEREDDRLLGARFPGFKDLVHDRANLVLGFRIFLIGFMMASYPVLLGHVAR